MEVHLQGKKSDAKATISPLCIFQGFLIPVISDYLQSDHAVSLPTSCLQLVCTRDAPGMHLSI